MTNGQSDADIAAQVAKLAAEAKEKGDLLSRTLDGLNIDF